VAVLHKRFIDLARQIAGQWDRLADSDRQRREFIANISHDLRTPLTSLLGYLETLTLKDDRLTPRSAGSISPSPCARATKSAIFRSSCLSWRDWSTAASSRSASVCDGGADFRRGAEV
jgi:signal transduction histidine kinase